MKEEVDISMVSSLKDLYQKRKAALKFLLAFRALKSKSRSKKFQWGSVFQKNRRQLSDNTSIENRTEVSRRSLQLASESYKTAMQHCNLGDILIVEQC